MHPRHGPVEDKLKRSGASASAPRYWFRRGPSAQRVKFEIEEEALDKEVRRGKAPRGDASPLMLHSWAAVDHTSPLQGSQQDGAPRQFDPILEARRSSFLIFFIKHFYRLALSTDRPFSHAPSSKNPRLLSTPSPQFVVVIRKGQAGFRHQAAFNHQHSFRICAVRCRSSSPPPSSLLSPRQQSWA